MVGDDAERRLEGSAATSPEVLVLPPWLHAVYDRYLTRKIVWPD